MKVRLCSGAILTMLLFCGHDGAVIQGSLSTSYPVSLSYESASPLTLHEPVFFDLKIHNLLGEKIWADLGTSCKENFVFEVVRPDGSSVLLQDDNEGGWGAWPGRVPLQSDGTYSERFLLSELYVFEEPGIYQIRVKLICRIHVGEEEPAYPFFTYRPGVIDEESGAIVSASSFHLTQIDGVNIAQGEAGDVAEDAGSATVLASDPVSLEILGRDPAALVQKCEALVSVIQDNPRSREAEDAAKVLSYIIDPVNVDYLGSILALGEWDRPAITGLARIGDPAAVRALGLAAQSKRKYARNLAKEMLERIEQGESDPLARGNLQIVD